MIRTIFTLAAICATLLAAEAQTPEGPVSATPVSATPVSVRPLAVESSETPAAATAAAESAATGSVQPTAAAQPIAATHPTAAADTAALPDAANLLRRGDRKGELLLAIGGHNITLGRAASDRHNRTRVTTPIEINQRYVAFGLGAVEFGFSLLTDPSYAAYAPEENGFLDQRVGKSIHIGFRPLALEVALNRSRTVSLVTGLTLSFDNYRFDNRWSIAKVDGRIEPVALEGKRKSKLATTQFGLPIGLTFTPARRLRVSALSFGELVVNAHTKTKKPKQKKTLTGLNDFRFGLQGAVTYREVGFYVKYSLTPMFRSGTGPKCYPLSVGLAWGF